MREPFSRYWYVRTCTHVFDYDDGYTDIIAAVVAGESEADTIRHYCKRLFTVDQVRAAKTFMLDQLGGRVRAIQVTIYKKIAP